MKTITDKIIAFIQETFREAGKSKAVIGISGGLDSAVVCALLVEALGEENVYGYSLPYAEQHDIEDAILVANTLGIYWETINILRAVNSYGDGNICGQDSTLRVANLKARVRMLILFDKSFVYNALVVGTSNKTELLLGYFTIYGDGACALEPIGHLYKTDVKELAKYLKIPDVIINKAPSAGLWDGQTDEKELGASYEEIDEILNFLYNKNYPIKEIESFWKKANPEMINKIARMTEKNKFKSELPKILKKKLGGIKL